MQCASPLRDELGVEVGAEPFGTTLAAVAGLFHAAERRLRRRDRNRVDADHARLHGVADRGCGRVRTRKRIGRQAVLQRVCALNHLVEGLEGDDGRDRPERFLRHHLGIIGHVGDDRRFVEKPLVAGPLAAGHHRAAALLRVRDETFHGVDAAGIGHRAHGDALFQPVTELDALGVLGKTRQEFLVRVLLHVEARRRDADLAGIAILERGDGVGGLLRIGVGEHHDRRMAAELHGGALHAFRGQRGEVLAHRDRAGE